MNCSCLFFYWEMNIFQQFQIRAHLLSINFTCICYSSTGTFYVAINLYLWLLWNNQMNWFFFSVFFRRSVIYIMNLRVVHKTWYLDQRWATIRDHLVPQRSVSICAFRRYCESLGKSSAGRLKRWSHFAINLSLNYYRLSEEGKRV